MELPLFITNSEVWGGGERDDERGEGEVRED